MFTNWFVRILVTVILTFICGCFEKPELGTSKNPLKMYFVPTDDTRHIAATAAVIESFLEKYISQRLYSKDDGFYIQTAIPSSFADLIRWWREDKTPWPEKVENHIQPNFGDRVIDHEIHVTFINHATVLVQTSGINFLTDPIYSERCSPLSFAGPKRVREPGVQFDKLPEIDVVLISHNHYDHLDLPTVRRLEEKFHPVFLVPLGNAQLLRSIGVKNVVELDWWEKFEHRLGFNFHFVPAKHWSGRGLFDRMETLWGGFVAESVRRKIYFAGDTGYSSHFKELKSRFDSMDLSLIPIGAYEPRWFMADNHMNPEEAVRAHLDLGSGKTLGIHFGTFQLTNEGIDVPLQELELARKKWNIEANSFNTLQFGETFVLR